MQHVSNAAKVIKLLVQRPRRSVVDAELVTTTPSLRGNLIAHVQCWVETFESEEMSVWRVVMRDHRALRGLQEHCAYVRRYSNHEKGISSPECIRTRLISLDVLFLRRRSACATTRTTILVS